MSSIISLDEAAAALVSVTFRVAPTSVSATAYCAALDQTETLDLSDEGDGLTFVGVFIPPSEGRWVIRAVGHGQYPGVAKGVVKATRDDRAD